MGVPRFVNELRAAGYPVITIDQDYGVSLVQPCIGGIALSQSLLAPASCREYDAQPLAPVTSRNRLPGEAPPAASNRPGARHASSILYFQGGVGDQLLLTCVARHLRRHGEKRIWVLSQSPGLFSNNPDVDHVLTGSPDDLHWIIKRHHACSHAEIRAPHRGEDRDIPPANHLLAVMCAQAG